MPSAVVNILHIMIGYDIHQELTPPGTPPIPVPVPIPHIATAPLGNVPGMLAGTVKCTFGNPTNDGIAGKLVFVNFVKMPIVIQGSDIGPVIPHIPLAPCTPLPFLPLIILGSGSTSEFFAFSVKANKKPVAIATLAIIGANLNCSFPCAIPSVVLAPSLVFTGTRFGDFVAGLAGMAMDIALSAIINAIFNGIGMKGDGGLFGKNGLMA